MKPTAVRPTKVRILGKVWTLHYTDRMTYADSVGTCFREVLRIEIKLGQPLAEEKDTVLHEVLHAIWGQMDIGQPSDEENAVRKLATGLTQVFQDNPSFHAYLGKI